MLASLSRILCTIMVLGWLSPAVAAPSVEKTVVEVAPDAERVSFYLGSKLELKKYFRLQSPHRLVLDLPRLKNGKAIGLSDNYRGAILKDIRFGQFDAQTSRIVMDLRGPIAKPTAYVVPPTGEHGWRLVVDLSTDKQMEQRNTRSRAIPPSPAKPTPPPRPALARDPEQTKVLADTSARKVSKAYRDRKGFAAPSNGEYAFTPTPQPKPLDQAKRASRPMIVIDAGHGGKDIGAKGRGGIREKDITIQYAKAMRDALEATGRYRVALTRDDDTYLLLRERVQVARGNEGDVFISLHADSNINPTAEGLSIYTVSEEASDAEAAALAAQENRSDIIGGIDLSHEEKAVADILIDLATRETRNKASELAEAILSSMDPKIPLITNPHRFAGFRVLKAADIPSILVEVGFLTNSRDERRILTREYRDKVTRSVVRGLDRYFEHHQPN